MNNLMFDIAHTSNELNNTLNHLPEDELHLLQARKIDGTEWKYIWRRANMLYLDFMTIKDLRKFFLDIRQPGHDYRIVRVSRYLPEDEIKPLPVEVIERLDNRS